MITNKLYILWRQSLDPDVVSSLFNNMPNTWIYTTLSQKEKIYSLLSSIEKQNKKVQSTEIYRKVPIISSMLYHQQKTMITNNFYILWCHILDPDVVSSLFMPNTLRADNK